jgi:hypothetical protein
MPLRDIRFRSGDSGFRRSDSDWRQRDSQAPVGVTHPGNCDSDANGVMDLKDGRLPIRRGIAECGAEEIAPSRLDADVRHSRVIKICRRLRAHHAELLAMHLNLP